MKHLIRLPLALLALLATSASAFAQTWNLVWADEFNGSSIDTSNWNFDIGTGSNGWGNNEQQYYRQQNATIENGNLVITARLENFGGKAYTSARLTTSGKKSWTYGKIEARIRMPSFAGSWPAFWMLGQNIGSVGWPSCGEIDVMEHINTSADITGAAHWSDSSNIRASYVGSIGTTVTGYHIYTVEWDSSYIRWFRDGVQYHEMAIGGSPNGTSEFHNNFYILLNLAIGGEYPGYTIDNSAFPAKMYVDWVRVYEAGSSPSPDISPTDARFMLVNKNSGKCVNLENGGLNNGDDVIQNAYDYNNADNHWVILPSAGGKFKILSAKSGKSLSIVSNSTANSALVHQWTYQPANTFMDWDILHQGDAWYVIRNAGSGKVLDVKGASTANGADIQQYSQNGGANQLFRLHPVGDYYIKTSTGTNNYLCVQGGTGENGRDIIQWTKQNESWFKWHFYSNTEGWSRASSLVNTSRSIAVKYGSASAGAQAHYWDNVTGDDQKLRIRPLQNGKYKFYFKHSGLAWDIPNGNSAKGVIMEQHPDNGNARQQFTLERIP